VPAPRVTTRRAWPADAETLARTHRLGLETWRAFAPGGWTLRPFGEHVALVRARLQRPDAWALLAFVDGEPAGHCSLLRDDFGDPAAADLWHLFVRPPWWGTGLAGQLHDAFLVRARELGYPRAWLGTPAAHARARRFYERRGWRFRGPLVEEDGLPLAIYGRSLAP
jgi:GNAT superfamily N-acetyltransferase